MLYKDIASTVATLERPHRVGLVNATVIAAALISAIFLASLVGAQPTASQQADLFDIRVNQATNADQHEPSLAVNPRDPNIILAAAKDWRTGPKQVWFYRSTDGGRTWADGHIDSLPSELPNQSDPVVSFDANGTAFLTMIGYNQNDLSVGGIFVVRSIDGGAKWQKPVLVAAHSESTFNDKEWTAIDRSSNAVTRDNVYVTWTLFKEEGPRRERGDIVISRSTDGGVTFSAPKRVNPIEQSTNQGSFPVVGPNGEVFVLYFSQGEGGDTLQVAKSSDGGLTFPQVTKAADVARPPSPLPGSNFRMFVLPTLAVDPKGGALYAIWNDYSAGNSDVKLVSSTDSGTSWSSPRRVNSDTSKADQFFPSAAVGADGMLHMIWLDRRSDAENKRFVPYYARSSGSSTVNTAEFPIGRASSDPDVGFEGTLIGDYLALDVSEDGKQVYAAWIDTRAGNQDIYFSAFSSSATYGPPGATPVAVPTMRSLPSPQPLTGFTNEAFRAQWERAEKPILSGRASRPWTWGPVSFAAAFEQYAQGRAGQREVQYFDKSRMEINNPGGDPAASSFVTNGLLVVEMISGVVQVGDREFQRPREPSDAPVAGDANSSDALTYRSLGSVASLKGDRRAPDRTGQAVTAVLSRNGVVRDDPTRGNFARNARYDPVIGHNIPDVFWSYLTTAGPIYNSRFGSYQSGPVLNWLSDVGYPITEPYWTNVRIDGTQRWVLLQAFQRRVLTYVAENPPGWAVEMGNVGRHYFDWRYGSAAPRR